GKNYATTITPKPRRSRANTVCSPLPAISSCAGNQGTHTPRNSEKSVPRFSSIHLAGITDTSGISRLARRIGAPTLGGYSESQRYCRKQHDETIAPSWHFSHRAPVTVADSFRPKTGRGRGSGAGLRYGFGSGHRPPRYVQLPAAHAISGDPAGAGGRTDRQPSQRSGHFCRWQSTSLWQLFRASAGRRHL